MSISPNNVAALNLNESAICLGACEAMPRGGTPRRVLKPYGAYIMEQGGARLPLVAGQTTHSVALEKGL